MRSKDLNDGGFLSSGWKNKKPKFETKCLLVTATWCRNYWDYNVWIITPNTWDNEFDGYMALLTGDGGEYGDLADLKADKYLVLPLLKNKK